MKKRIISFVSAGIMAVSVLLAGQRSFAEVDYAEDDVVRGDGITTPITKILTASDYQKWYDNGKWDTDDWDALQPQFQGIVGGAAGSKVNPDYFLFGGDFSCLGSLKETSDEGESQVLSILRSKWPNLTDEKCVLIQGNHDPANMDNLRPTGPIYFKDFIIYVINEDDFPTKQGEVSVQTLVENTAYALDEWLYTMDEKKETRPIIIASHTGLHYDIDRKDGNNQFAYIMFDVVNEWAGNLDIVFMFGHNHTNGDEQVGGSVTFYAPGEKLAVCHEDSIANKQGTKTELNFAYMNYGYIGYIGDIHNNPSELEVTNKLTVGLFEIYNDRIEITKYSKDGRETSFDNVIERKNKIVPQTESPKPTDIPTDAPGNPPDVTTSKPINSPVVSSEPKVTSLSKVIGVKAKKKGAKKVALSWRKIKGAKGYQIIYSADKKLKKGVKKIKVKKNKATVKMIKKNKPCYYKVRAFAGNVYGKSSKVIKVK